MDTKNYKDYLDKTFLEELNYKIWTTKGSRFNANKRLKLISKTSNLTNSMLTVYLIAIGLLSVYNIYNDKLIESNLIAYLVTCLSILLLVFSQTENSKDYSKKANDFHSCGIALAKLYNNLRVFKTLKSEPTSEEKESFAKEISDKYESILEKFDNHEHIDYSLFKTRNSKYFELSLFDVLWIRIYHYFRTQLFYHIMILVPPILIVSMLIAKNT